MSLPLRKLSKHKPDMQKVSPHPRVVGTGRVGVEIELENLPNPPRDLEYWDLHNDGSLRNNGIEFVFRHPYGGESIWLAINEIVRALGGHNPDASWRTSTHIHVDVRDLTVKQLRNMILLYAGYEPMLFKLHGEHRMYSIFCPAVDVAKDQVRILSSLLNCKEEELFRYPFGDKYSSMNVSSIINRGSIEFRGSEAKWKCVHLLRLINRLLTIRELAISMDETPFEEIIDFAVKTPLREVFGTCVPTKEPALGWDRKTSEIVMKDIVGLAQLPVQSNMPKPKPAMNEFIRGLERNIQMPPRILNEQERAAHAEAAERMLRLNIPQAVDVMVERPVWMDVSDVEEEV